MLNLLFISDNPKAEHIKSELQPLLKVMVDVVTDFDRGMKEVFEKRPATVCIQDHIGSVSGESVARHIQMLLGSAAPTFILLHQGNNKTKVISGLFEYLVDLSPSNKVIIENILGTLKLLLGSQWERVFIPPRQTPEQSGTVNISPVVHAASAPSAEDGTTLNTPDKPLTSNDEIVELLLARSKMAEQEVKSATDYSKLDIISVAASVAEINMEKPISSGVSLSSQPNEPPLFKTPPKKPADSVLPKNSAAPFTPPATPPAESFRIGQITPRVEDTVPEDLLFTFEENYRSRSIFNRRNCLIALLCVVSAAGAWSLLTQQPQMLNSLKQRFLPSPQAPVIVTPAVPPPVAAPALPSFIPQEGLDSSFAQKNRGWNRFVGEKYEFRVFTASDRIQAIQVLSAHDSIPESLLASVLQEFVGRPTYVIDSRSSKNGVRIESGRVGDKGEIKIYRKRGSVKAFVVSVN